jgi:hypothetical protein
VTTLYGTMFCKHMACQITKTMRLCREKKAHRKAKRKAEEEARRAEKAARRAAREHEREQVEAERRAAQEAVAVEAAREKRRREVEVKEAALAAADRLAADDKAALEAQRGKRRRDRENDESALAGSERSRRRDEAYGRYETDVTGLEEAGKYQRQESRKRQREETQRGERKEHTFKSWDEGPIGESAEELETLAQLRQHASDRAERQRARGTEPQAAPLVQRDLEEDERWQGGTDSGESDSQPDPRDRHAQDRDLQQVQGWRYDSGNEGGEDVRDRGSNQVMRRQHGLGPEGQWHRGRDMRDRAPQKAEQRRKEAADKEPNGGCSLRVRSQPGTRSSRHEADGIELSWTGVHGGEQDCRARHSPRRSAVHERPLNRSAENTLRRSDDRRSPRLSAMRELDRDTNRVQHSSRSRRDSPKRRVDTRQACRAGEIGRRPTRHEGHIEHDLPKHTTAVTDASRRKRGSPGQQRQRGERQCSPSPVRELQGGTRKHSPSQGRERQVGDRCSKPVPPPSSQQSSSSYTHSSSSTSRSTSSSALSFGTSSSG